MENKIMNKVVVRRWGNSHGIRIPKDYMEMLHINENEPVEMSVEDNVITIRKCRKFNSLKERLENFYGKPIDNIYIENVKEVDWGAPEGAEVW